jgi:hypothetical protein
MWNTTTVKRALAAILATGAIAVAVPATSFADGGGAAPPPTTAEPGGGGH